MKRFSTHYFAIITVFLLANTFVFAQGLPNYATPEELELLRNYHPPVANLKSITQPPGGKIRTAAEWEEIQALCITWTNQPTLLREIVRYAREECLVIITCADSNAVKTSLTNGNVPLSNIAFLEKPYNTIWMRDYGANTVYRNDVDSLFLVDWIYNRPRPKDDTIPSSIANFLSLDLYTTTQAPNDLVHTGGNFMSDGFGNSFSSKLTHTENGASGQYNITVKTPAMVDTIMKRYMGITRPVWWDVLPFDGIHHIDMHAKLLNEEVLLMGQYPAGIADGPQIEANLLYAMNNFNSLFGTPYKVVRIPMPPETNGSWPSGSGDYLTYTNSVFINKTILVPKYYTQYDTIAMRIYKENLPGYRVIQLDCNNIISQSGAIHCITHSVGVNDPLLISHQQLPNTSDSSNPYPVNAYINHRSGIANATLYWSTDTTQPYNPVSMNVLSIPDHTFTADVPAQNPGTRVFYYIAAESVSGKQQVRPITAPQGYFYFDVENLSTATSDHAPIQVQDIFPNPGSAITCLPVVMPNEAPLSIDIYNLTGHHVRNVHSGNAGSGQRYFFTDCSSLSPGMYIVNYRSNGRLITRKLCVK